jgi:hypothetical protein
MAEEKPFFFEEKDQKTFACGRARGGTALFGR